MPACESCPLSRTAAYVAWREELQRFQRTNQLPDDAMTCLLLEQSALLGGLIDLLVEDSFIEDVLTPARERERERERESRRRWHPKTLEPPGLGSCQASEGETGLGLQAMGPRVSAERSVDDGLCLVFAPVTGPRS